MHVPCLKTFDNCVLLRIQVSFMLHFSSWSHQQGTKYKHAISSHMQHWQWSEMMWCVSFDRPVKSCMPKISHFTPHAFTLSMTEIKSKSSYVARNLIMKLKVLWESHDILIHYLLGGCVCVCVCIHDEELFGILLLLFFLKNL